MMRMRMNKMMRVRVNNMMIKDDESDSKSNNGN